MKAILSLTTVLIALLGAMPNTEMRRSRPRRFVHSMTTTRRRRGSTG